MISDEDLLLFLHEQYGVGEVLSLRWGSRVSEERIAFLETPQERYVLRVYPHQALSKTDFLAEYLTFLEANGVMAERLILSTERQAVCRLPSGDLALLFQFHDGAPLETVSRSEYCQWGKYVGRLHRQSCSFESQHMYLSPLTSRSSDEWLDDALDCVQMDPHAAKVVGECGDLIQRECGLQEAKSSVVHGDLWPGNLLLHDSQVRAIDFGEAGFAPLEVDLGTAFRWMPLERPEFVREEWKWWWEAYQSEWGSSVSSLATVVAWAVLQQLRYLIEEVRGCAEGKDDPGIRPQDYVADHTGQLEQLLSEIHG